MKKTRYIEPLPKHKVYAAYLSGALGVTLFLLSFFGESTESVPLVLRGFGITFLTVAILELLPEWIRYALERKERQRFLSFFGQIGGSKPLKLISAGRAVSDTHLPYLRAVPMPNEAKGAVPEGVRFWMAGEDIRASSYLSQTLAIQDVAVSIETAAAVSARKPDFSSVSLGLGFNCHTLKLAQIHEGRLFDASFKSTKIRDKEVITDYISIGGVEPNRPPSGRDFALVCRILDENKRDLIHFVAAGRSAQGTAVAGYFLAHGWQQIADLYDADDKTLSQHSVAVLIEHRIDSSDSPEYADDSGSIVRHAWV